MTVACFRAHLGLYFCETSFLRGAASVWSQGGDDSLRQFVSLRYDVRALTGQWRAAGIEIDADGDDDAPRDFATTSDGVALIAAAGPILKGRSKLPHANSLDLRRMVRDAAADPKIAGIMLHMDSPGGTVAGTEELATDVAAARERKPVHAHADDLMASAAYWIGSQADRITANATGFVGSIGVYGVIEDSSEAAKQQGVKVHLVTTGPLKGQGEPGVPVSDEALGEIQGHVDGLNRQFLAAIKRGRGMRIADVRAVADGRMFAAADAQAAGLIDGVGSFDDALRGLRGEIRRRRAEERAASDRARAAVDLGPGVGSC